SNRSSPFNISVNSRLLPEHFTPFQLLYDGIIDPTPALTAVTYPCMWSSRSSLSLNRVSPWSRPHRPELFCLGSPVPQVVPPSPAKCLAQASTLRGFDMLSP